MQGRSQYCHVYVGGIAGPCKRSDVYAHMLEPHWVCLRSVVCQLIVRQRELRRSDGANVSSMKRLARRLSQLSVVYRPRCSHDAQRLGQRKHNHKQRQEQVQEKGRESGEAKGTQEIMNNNKQKTGT